MSDDTIAYYEDGVPHSADGEVVIDMETPVCTEIERFHTISEIIIKKWAVGSRPKRQIRR